MPDECILFDSDPAKADRMKVSSPAKINLHLRIGPPAPSGFHPLLSWMCKVGLNDKLTFTRAPRTELRCSDPSLPCDSRNLIIRVVALLHRELLAQGVAERNLPHASIELEKIIPMGGGLGGGSSNAACTLTALNGLWGTKLTERRVMELGAELGSDVPFFFFGMSSFCEGRGERITPLPLPKPKAAVLFLPDLSMPTPTVYRKFDEMKLGSPDALTKPDDFAKWTDLSAAQLLPKLINDLEAPACALEPRLGALRAEIEQTCARIVRMSGSGSTLFTLCDELTEADTLATCVSERCGVRSIALPLARFEI